MFRRMWRWLFGGAQVADDEEDEVEQALRRSNFTGAAHDERLMPSASKLYTTYMQNVEEVLPVLHQHATQAAGEAMDSMDEYGGDIGSDLMSPAMRQPDAAPNISGVIVGFFLRQTFLGHQLCALLAQHWLIAKCCWMPAQDAVRKGFTINTPEGDGSQTVKILKRYDKRMKLRRNMTQFVGFGKTFGIRVAIFQVDHPDPLFYEYPFDPESVGPHMYKGIIQVDPYWCVPELDQKATADPDSMHFYEPTWWVINGKRYHRSHLAIYREGDVADILKPSYLYGGVPVPQRVVERVYAAERTANEGPELAMSKRLITLKTDLAEMLAGGPDALVKLNRWTQMMNNFGVKLIGTDEDVATHDTSLSDFDALTMTQYQLVASAAEVPATKLLGTSPKGFGASGDYEIESYHETLESIQAGPLTDLVDGHHLRLMYSEVAPVMLRKDPAWTVPEVEIVFEPLDSPTSTELAQINLSRSQAARNYVDIGALDGVDVRDNLIADRDSGYSGIPGAYRPDEEPQPGEVPAPRSPQMTGSDPTEQGIFQ